MCTYTTIRGIPKVSFHSELVKFHIKTQYDINKKGYCIEEIIPRNAGEAAAQQSYIKEYYNSVDIDNIDYK